MRVRDVLGDRRGRVITLDVTEELMAAVKLMRQHNIGGLAIIGDDRHLVGFLSEREVVDAMQEHRGDVRHVRVSSVMCPPPTCELDDKLTEIMTRMTRDRIRHLVVVDQGRAIAILSIGDLVKYRLAELETETGVLRDYVAAQRAL